MRGRRNGESTCSAFEVVLAGANEAPCGLRQGTASPSERMVWDERIGNVREEHRSEIGECFASFGVAKTLE